MKRLGILSAFLLLAAVGCVQEIEQPDPIVNPETADGGADGTVTLTAVIDDDLTRTVLDSDNYVCWADGDEVWINGSTYTVSVSGNTATISGVTTATHYACVYPASVATGFIDGCKVKITLPQDQSLTFDGSGRQVLSLPMAAYGDGTSSLTFKNLCGLVGVTVSNTTYDSITPASMTLTTGGDVDWVAPLYGQTGAARDLSSSNIGNDWAILASNIGNSGERGQLNITVNNPVSIANGGSRTYYITVPVIDDGTKSNLTLDVSGTVSGGNAFKFKKTTSSTKTIARNCVGTIPVSSSLCYEIKTSGSQMKGSGTASDPYQISCPDHWEKISQLTLDKQTEGVYFLQVCDIDFGGMEIRPIGVCGYKVTPNFESWIIGFSGIYDGNGFKISNFTIKDQVIDNPYYTNVFLAPFGAIVGGTLKNLTVDYNGSYTEFRLWGYDVSLDVGVGAHSVKSVAGVVGYAGNDSVLSNLEFIGSLIHTVDHNHVGSVYIAGIVDEVDHAASLDHLTFNGTISSVGSSLEQAGGIAGFCVADNISHCCATKSSEISLKDISLTGTGGLFGYLRVKASFDDNVFAGKIKMEGNINKCRYFGGIVGYCELNSLCNHISEIETDSDATFSFSIADAKGDFYIGGLFGRLYNYATCSVDMKNYTSVSFFVNSSNDKFYIGGISGWIDGGISGKVNNYGTITAQNPSYNIYAGGLFGYVDFDTSIITDLADCTNTGNVIATSNGSNSYAGGVAGYWTDGTAKVTDFTNTGEVKAECYGFAYAGGLFGYIDCDLETTFENCSNTKAVTAKSTYQGNYKAYAGGLVGYWNDRALHVKGCSNSGKVEASAYGNTSAAGLIAWFDGSSTNSSFESSSNTGAVTATSGDDYAYSGGLLAYLDGNGEVVIVNEFRNSGAITSIGNGNDDAIAGGVVGNDDDSGSNNNLMIFNSENTGGITATCSNDPASAGGIIGYHNSDGGTYHPCVINCCNRGTITATAGNNNRINCGGLMGYCYFSNDGTSIRANYSRCKYFSEDQRGEIKCGGLSGTKVLEYDCYWSKLAHDGIGMLEPNFSWENGDSDKGTGAFTGSNSDLINNLNTARSSVPAGEIEITYPALLEWTAASDGFPVLNFGN